MQTITNEDVRSALPAIPHINASLIEVDVDTLRDLLVIFGIRNRQQLDKFVKAKEVFDFLADVYVRELGRPQSAPLDPTAVATWGVVLFIRGLRGDMKHEIIRKIRESDEYKQKHKVLASLGGGS